jgi:hypothetical protein
MSGISVAVRANPRNSVMPAPIGTRAASPNSSSVLISRW